VRYPRSDVRLLQEYVSSASADTRFALVVLGAFAVVSLVLTGLGVYGVVAYATARRTHEIAVRMALGAAPGSIVSLVIHDGLAWTLIGIAAGLSGALALSRYLGTLLFRVGERDPLTFPSVALLLGAIVLLTMGVTALRAVRIDPRLALRAD
jgi:putative ABC transport system permease protein